MWWKNPNLAPQHSYFFPGPDLDFFSCSLNVHPTILTSFFAPDWNYFFSSSLGYGLEHYHYCTKIPTSRSSLTWRELSQYKPWESCDGDNIHCRNFTQISQRIQRSSDRLIQTPPNKWITACLALELSAREVNVVTELRAPKDTAIRMMPRSFSKWHSLHTLKYGFTPHLLGEGNFDCSRCTDLSAPKWRTCWIY